MNFKAKAQLPHPYLLAIGFFLIFSGIRIHLIMLYASQTPYWDDWSMGARMAMYVESGFDTTWLYGLTNEHRATFSKITNLILFDLNSEQWDPYLTMVFDTFIWATTGIALLYIGFKEKMRINPWFFSALIIILWTYPLSLFNILSTIQTYLYYMTLFVICGFWLVTHKAFSLKWCLGILLIAAACMTTGGGSFAPVAVTTVSCFLAIFNKQDRRQHLITFAAAGVFAAFGLYLILSQKGSADFIHTKSLGEYFTSLFKTLSWPNSNRVWPSIIFLLPIGLLALAIVRQKIAQSRITTFTLIMATFSIMIAIAISYARSMYGRGPSERYFDFLTIYLISSALALMLIQGSKLTLPTLFNNNLIILWVIVLITAIPFHIKVAQFQLNDRATLVPIQDDIMARYSVNSDPKIFENSSFREVPYTSINDLQTIMSKLSNTDALPYNLQSSNMVYDTNNNHAFIVNGIRRPKYDRYRGLELSIGSFNPHYGGLMAKGEYTSELFEAKRSYLMIPVSGFLGYEGTSLKLIGENNNKVIEVTPEKNSLDNIKQWRDILVKAPDKTFRIVAKDETEKYWFAYAAPRSVGKLSYYFDRLIKNGDKIWMFGLLILFFACRQKVIAFIKLNYTNANVDLN